MKFSYIISIFLSFIFFSTNESMASYKNSNTISQARYDKVCRWGVFNPPECKKPISKSEIKKIEPKSDNEKKVQSKANNSKIDTGISNSDCRWGIFNPPKCKGRDSRVKSNKEYKKITKKNKSFSNNSGPELSFYTGTFDTIDKEGDDKTTLFGLEHKNPDLFRNTVIGKFKPVTGAFVTGKSSLYLYTGIEGQYNLGPIKILPSFAPGYYEKGDGKDLGSVLEFKSEVKVGIDVFKNSKIGYSYSHISNNDWGDLNPGTDNQTVTFSKKF